MHDHTVQWFVNAGYGCNRFTGLNATLQSLPSQFTLRHHPSAPVVPQGLDFPLLFLRQFQQTEPLGDPIRGDAVPLPELHPGEVMPEHLGLEFTGEDDGVAVWTPGLLRLQNYVGTGNCQGVRFAAKGSTQRKTGVPDY